MLILGAARAEQPRNLARINYDNPICAHLIGLIDNQHGPREIISNRRMQSNGVIQADHVGRSRTTSATLGTWTNRREFLDWEPSMMFSFILYWRITTYAAASANIAGNSGTGDGFAIRQRFGTGARSYLIGTQTLDPGPSYPLNAPIMSVMTWDGAVLSAYHNGASEGTIAATTAPVFGSFCRVHMGNGVDVGSMIGNVWYMGLCHHPLKVDDARSLTENPWQLFEPNPRRIWSPAAAAAGGFNAAWAGGNVMIQPGAMVQ